MNKDRIQINGDWYVKEASKEEAIVLVITQTEGYTVENDEFCLEATRLIDMETKLPYPGDISLEITDKRSSRLDWKRDYWDNNAFLIGVLSGNKSSLKLLDSWSKENITFLQKFLKFLKKENWL